MNEPGISTPDTPADTLWQRLADPGHRLLWIGAITVLIAGVLWMSFTPAGVLGKADAVGYAVCHRITVRSFLFPDGRQLPMCARCSGTFLGVLVGLLGPGLLLGRRRAALFPPTGIVLVMLAFSLFWAFDGANSFTFLLPPGLPHLYEPSNFLRLFSGMFHGITMGSLLLPVASATLWADATSERTLLTLWHYLALVGIGAILIGMVLSGLAVLLYPLAVLSAVGAIAVLSTINTVIMASVLGQENRAHSYREALPLILFGIAMTLTLIGLIDVGRYALFGTWDGFTIPGA